MKIKKLYKIIASFILLNILLFLLFFSTSNVTVGKAILGTIAPKKIIYELTSGESIILSSEKGRDYPFAATAPGSSKYIFTVLKEDYDVYNLKNTPIFYAGKRISELQNWGSSMPILHSYSSISGLESWWKKTPPSPWELNKKNVYNSWEASFARYFDLVKSEITETRKNHDSKPQLALIRKCLESDFIFLKEIISTSKKSDAEKSYLTKISTDIFNYYNNQLFQQSSPIDPSLLPYSLDLINQTKDSGIFKASIDRSSLQDFTESDLSATVDHTTLSAVFDKTSNQFVFNSVSLNGNKVFYLHLPFINLLESTSWQKLGSGYQTTPLKLKNDYTYLFSISDSLTQPIHVTVKQNTKTLVDKTYLSNLKQQLFQSLIVYGNSMNGPVVISLLPVEPISDVQFNSIQMKLQPVYRPPVTIEKTAPLPNHDPKVTYTQKDKNLYEVDVQNTNSAQDTFIIKSFGAGWKMLKKNTINSNHYQIFTYFTFHTIYLWLCLIDTAIVAVFFFYLLLKKISPAHATLVDKVLSTIYTQQKKSILLSLKHILKKLRTANQFFISLSTSYRTIFIVISVLLFIYSILFNTFQTDIITFGIAIFYLFTTLSWKRKTNVHFSMAFIFVFIAFIAQLARLDTISENISIWAVLLLFIGTISLIATYFNEFRE